MFGMLCNVLIVVDVENLQ